MIRKFRQDFNRQYRPELYSNLLASLERATGGPIEFRVAESPCFFSMELMEHIAAIGSELTRRLVDDPDYLWRSRAAIPDAYRMPEQSEHPHFMTADFGLVRTPQGELEPRLVELQAFPSIFAYQCLLAEAYRETYALDDGLDPFLGGHTENSFWRLFSRVILGDHDPENVVLSEVDPLHQKTLPDFRLTADRLGISIVDISELVKIEQAGGPPKLFRRDGHRLVPVHRIYNRAIVDELVRRNIQLPFDYREPIDVEWAGHPNWYFHISKFSLPFLHHPAVPPAVFLNEWLEGRERDRLPADRDLLILKPLFSFAGKGIQFAPSDEDLLSIPEPERGGYLLQERVQFEPVIDTPFGMTQAEIRILYLWPDGGDLDPVLSLIRLGRGKMMGVDHNRDQQWVGGSAAFCPPRAS
ncbi:hypothetical protein ACPOL_0454 [Acidisarcina polymorpha]|uniref:Glutathionylspermidine synthase pre-ATP-grasp-like domain-containing protein n=1 Tax=Acidisarcina polymorpha TaxID=2211140 RepID=A0A2Z5FSL2_9BACT|nr:hypothetical protein [Acidisarcina polymorpha]AXC09831.1 hypothetical protein ACPOL_0454 [Acidisarcina polymorpha]